MPATEWTDGIKLKWDKYADYSI